MSGKLMAVARERKGRTLLNNVLWTLVAAINIALLIFLLNSLWVKGVFSKTSVMSAKNDLPLGSEIPSPLRPFLEEHRPLLLVTFGQCSECTLGRLGEWVVMLERWSDQVKGVIVATEKRETLERLWKEQGWKVAYFANEDGKVLRALNAWFLPRAYGFNQKGELVWRQENPEVSELQAIRSLVELVKGKEYAREVFDRPPAWKEALEKPKGGERK